MAELLDYEAKQHSNNLFSIHTKHDKKLIEIPVFNSSDWHFDSKYCQRETLKGHLERAKRKGAFIAIYGDLFDLMGSKKDPRSSTGDIRPEYHVKNYLDAVIEDLYEFLIPYADNIIMMAYGNHETKIVKHMETDPLARLHHMLSQKTDKTILIGGYDGNIRFQGNYEKGSQSTSFLLYYNHGFGMNPRRTKGMLNVDIALKEHPDADIILQGHIHHSFYAPDNVERVIFQNGKGILEDRKKLYIQLPSYKNDMTNVKTGWAKEKGFKAPEIGGAFTKMRYKATNSRTYRDIEFEHWDQFMF